MPNVARHLRTGRSHATMWRVVGATIAAACAAVLYASDGLAQWYYTAPAAALLALVAASAIRTRGGRIDLVTTVLSTPDRVNLNAISSLVRLKAHARGASTGTGAASNADGTLDPTATRRMLRDVFGRTIGGRFRQCLLADNPRSLNPLNWWPRWSPDAPGIDPDDLDMDLHVTFDDSVRTEHELRERWTAAINTPLPRERPPWEVIVMNRAPAGPREQGQRDSERTGATPALIIRLHHSMGDGIGILRLILQGLLRESDGGVGGGKEGRDADGVKGTRIRRRAASVGRGTPSTATTADKTKATGGDVPHPHRAPASRVPRLGQVLAKLPSALVKLLASPADPASPIHLVELMHPTQARAVAYHTLEMPLDELKALGRAHGGTVNDVIGSVVTGALRQFSIDKLGREPDASVAHSRDAGTLTVAPCKMVMWFSLDPLKMIYEPFTAKLPARWGNSRLGAVWLKMPLDDASPTSRMRKLAAEIEDIKTSPEPFLAQGILGMMGALPGGIARPVWNLLAYKTSVSFSNVPGPQFPLHLCGREISALHFTVPPNGNIGFLVSVVSYNGRVSVAVSTDTRVCSAEEAQRLVDVLVPQELRLLTQEPTTAVPPS